jgi:hypothetical protein
LASGERFFEMICSCVKNCEAIMSTTSTTRITIATVLLLSTALMSVSCSDATPKSFAS